MDGILISFTDEAPEPPRLVTPSIVPSNRGFRSAVAGQDAIAEESIKTAGHEEVIEPMSVPSFQSTTALPKSAAAKAASTSGGLVLEKPVAATAPTYNTIARAGHRAKAVEALTYHQKNLLRLVLARERKLPPCDDRVTLSVRDALVAIKEKILSGEYTRQTFIDNNNMVINSIRLQESTWSLDGAQLIKAREAGTRHLNTRYNKRRDRGQKQWRFYQEVSGLHASHFANPAIADAMGQALSGILA